MYCSSKAVLILGPLRFPASPGPYAVALFRVERVNIISDDVIWVLGGGSYPLSRTI